MFPKNSPPKKTINCVGIYYSAGSLIREHNRGNSLDCCLQPSFTPDKFEMQVLVKMTHISLNTACHKSFRCFVCRFCNSLDSLVEMNENHNSKGQNLKKEKEKEKLEAKMQKVWNILHYVTWIFKMLCLCIFILFLFFNNSALNYVVEANSNIVSQVFFSFLLLLFFFFILLHTESNAYYINVSGSIKMQKCDDVFCLMWQVSFKMTFNAIKKKKKNSFHEKSH